MALLLPLLDLAVLPSLLLPALFDASQVTIFVAGRVIAAAYALPMPSALAAALSCAPYERGLKARLLAIWAPQLAAQGQWLLATFVAAVMGMSSINRARTAPKHWTLVGILGPSRGREGGQKLSLDSIRRC